MLLLAIWRLGRLIYQSHVLNPSWHFLRWSTIRATGNVVLERAFRKNRTTWSNSPWNMNPYIYIYTHRVWYHQGWLQGPRRGPGASKIGPSTWRIWQHWSCQMAKQQERTAVKPRTRHSLSYPNGRFNIKHQDENFIPNLAHWAPNQEDVYITALWHLHHVSKMKTSKYIYIHIIVTKKNQYYLYTYHISLLHL